MPFEQAYRANKVASWMKIDIARSCVFEFW